MKLFYDLHIHSCLSPCSDDDMTPNNIVNMAKLKGLDVISVTDHNMVLNLPACQKVADEVGLLLVPGIEVQTKEDVHCLGYFPSLEAAMSFGEALEEYRLKLPNKPDRFGYQRVLDENDEVIDEVAFSLLLSLTLSMEKFFEMVNAYGGVAMPAHIDRESNSVITNLGFIPPALDINSIEVSLRESGMNMMKKDFVKDYLVIRNSDAHHLWDISEPERSMEVEDKSIASVISYLRGE